MRVDKDIKEEISFVLTVETLVKAYQEVAVLKMQRARTTVLSTREFLELLHEVFSDVKKSYAKEIRAIKAKEKQANPQQKPKKAGVFLSANSRFYGDIIKRVFRNFIQDYQKSYDEMIIMGRVGKEMLEETGKNIPYRYIDYDDNNINKDLLLKFIQEIKDFDVVQLYYGKFENVVTQSPAVTVVTGEEDMGANSKDQRIGFFFEPSLAEVLSYFENQVVSAFLLQSIHESDLAKLASRTKSMEAAHQRIEDRQKKLYLEERKAKKVQEDKKQQERLSGMYIWKK